MAQLKVDGRYNRGTNYYSKNTTINCGIQAVQKFLATT